MNPPTPAAVRAALKDGRAEPLTSDERDACLDDGRMDVAILRDHIRAVCAEMREEADEYTKLAHGSVYELAEFRLRTAKTLGRFADRLEGREP